MKIENTVKQKMIYRTKRFPVIESTGEIKSRVLIERTSAKKSTDYGFLKLWPRYLTNFLYEKGNCDCRVLAYLIDRMNIKNKVCLSHREISNEMKISLPSIKKALKDLAEFDIIREYNGEITVNPAFLVYGSSGRRLEIYEAYEQLPKPRGFK